MVIWLSRFDMIQFGVGVTEAEGKQQRSNRAVEYRVWTKYVLQYCLDHTKPKPFTCMLIIVFASFLQTLSFRV